MALKLFSNILAYRMTDYTKIHLHDDLNEALGTRAARLPGPLELNAVGFTEPCGEEGAFIERVNGTTFVIAINRAERLVPGKIVRQRVQARVRGIEDREERKVYAREKNQIKDEILQKMLPQAFIDQKVIYAMVTGPYILVDSTSAKRGEDFLSMLREVIGSLGVRPVAVKTTPIDAFTRWFTTDETPVDFHLTGDFKANSGGDESDFINGKGTSPKTEGLSDLVMEFSRRVTVLGLAWATSTGENAYFTVNEMIGIKGIKWPESLADMAVQDVGEEDDANARAVTMMRATFLLLAAELERLLHDLLYALGGEEVPDNAEQDTAAQKLLKMGEDYRAQHKATVVQSGGDADFDEGDDPLYAEAVAFVRESKRASISAIQRKLKIGYNRAARMIERMEEEGVVTEMNSNGSREVIATSSKTATAAKLLAEIDEDDLV